MRSDTMKKKTKKVDMDKGYQITSMCRTDMLSRGFTKAEVSSLDESDMTYIARKMADAYCDCCFWLALEQITRYRLDSNMELPSSCECEKTSPGCGAICPDNASMCCSRDKKHKGVHHACGAETHKLYKWK